MLRCPGSIIPCPFGHGSKGLEANLAIAAPRRRQAPCLTFKSNDFAGLDRIRRANLAVSKNHAAKNRALPVVLALLYPACDPACDRSAVGISPFCRCHRPRRFSREQECLSRISVNLFEQYEVFEQMQLNLVRLRESHGIRERVTAE